MTEQEIRAAVVVEAKSWIGTPYRSNALVKGRRGGTDCAMILIGVYRNVGLLPMDYDPRPYPEQWHLHRNEEKYLTEILKFAKPVAAPPERMPLPGDVVMFRMGRLLAHAAIVVDWPIVIHANGNGGVMPDDISKNTTGKRALWPAEKSFFSIWEDKQ